MGTLNEDDGYIDFNQVGNGYAGRVIPEEELTGVRRDGRDEDDDEIEPKNFGEPPEEELTETPSARLSTSELMLQDLMKSGLETSDLDAIVADAASLSSIGMPPNTRAYVIRYRHITGGFRPFSRFRLFDGKVKYRQVKSTANHIYFPPNFLSIYNRVGKKLIVITEGEKKAAALSKHGIPCVALSGVDSWHNKYMVIPKTLTQEPHPTKKDMLVFRVDAESKVDTDYVAGVAIGFEDLMTLIRQNNTTVVMCYDIDHSNFKALDNVQRAAAKLGFEMRNLGIKMTSIRQILLPKLHGLDKVGLDDYLMHDDGGIERFKKVLDETLQKASAFPQYPNIRDFIGKVLGKPRITRKQYIQTSLALLTDLDSKGKRLYSPGEEQLYYFSQQSKHLMKVQLNEGVRDGINETEFGRSLYQEYDVSPVADSKLIQWLGAQMSGEAPIEHINPSRIISRPKDGEDCVRFQLNDGQFIKVTGNPDKPFQILSNGDDSTLFSSGGTLPISGDELAKALSVVSKEPLKPWWFDVLKDVKLKDHGDGARAMGLLYYISPWLYRWRGTQLPIEMVCGESGSGKSTLVSLRLNILTGEASLKNAPTDLKDWYASITKSGGMHVIDNLHFTDKQLAQRMSDELCRLVTEPNPSIEQRKYFTNADIVKFPINAIFSFTAIKQPFNNADLIQRSFILELDKVADLNLSDGNVEVKDYAFDGYWLQHQLEKFGGRVNWVAHHIWVLHNFFKTVNQMWDHRYKAKYRLINLEQAMVVMAKTFGIESDWIPNYLSTTTNRIISNSDWTMEGLKAFADKWRKEHADREFKVSEIVQWCGSHESFEDCQMLQNPRTLGRYLQTAKFNIATIAGIIESSNRGNMQFYKVAKPGANVR